MGCVFSGWCSVTIFLTDLGGTVTQHDGNFLAVEGFSFFDGKKFGGYGNSNCDGTFTAVTQHDGNLPAADGFRFLGAASKWPYATHISRTEEKAETTIFLFFEPKLKRGFSPPRPQELLACKTPTTDFISLLCTW